MRLNSMSARLPEGNFGWEGNQLLDGSISLRSPLDAPDLNMRILRTSNRYGTCSNQSFALASSCPEGA
ncbi:hypothetical protein JTE90_007795 [Oedothorax gibbosus]|uniref:Uncharacterized protein n=1 Tax=Oedothorax gibbosus TaxID=931172 RepID=A0AAV6TET9_9ARAC|nr:hypothetical protein JTE90_007795 [Oedothorax gibbosus]